MNGSLWSAPLLVALVVCFAGGCSAAPEERLATAWAAAADEDAEAFFLHFTEGSRDLLRGLQAVAERTRGDMAYLSPVFEVLPKGEVAESKIHNNLALVTVKAKRRQGEVRLLRERGEWCIDATTLPELWGPLRTSGKED